MNFQCATVFNLFRFKITGQALTRLFDGLFVGLFQDNFESRNLFEQVKDARVDVRPPVEHGAGPAPHVADQFLVVPRRVGRMAHIDGNSHLRIHTVGCRSRPTQPDLFSHRRHTENTGPQLAAFEQPQRLHHHPEADFVVHCWGRRQAVAERVVFQNEGHRVAAVFWARRVLVPEREQRALLCLQRLKVQTGTAVTSAATGEHSKTGSPQVTDGLGLLKNRYASLFSDAHG